MAITIKASTGALKEAAEGSDLETIDFNGYHIFELVKVDSATSKAGNPQLVCSYKLIGMTRQGAKPTKKYWPLKDYVQLEGDTTEWKRAEFLTAVNGGKTKVEIAAGKPGTIIGNKVICRLELEEYTNDQGVTKTQARIAKVLPFVPPAAGMGKPDDEGDIPDEEIVEEEVIEEEEEEVITDEGYEPWTRDDLKAAGKDKIREVAGSFGVEIVAGMKLADILDAVMEAQDLYMDQKDDVSEEGTEVVDDEDAPF